MYALPPPRHTRAARLSVIGVIAILAVQGCQSTSDRPITGTAHSVASSNLAVAHAAEGRLTLRVIADSTSQQRYLFAADSTPIGLAELTNRLEAARRAAPEQTTLEIYTYPGALGYDVLMAMNAAREAGVGRVEGIADFSDDDGKLAREEWKQWSRNLAADGPGAARPDTSVAG